MERLIRAINRRHKAQFTFWDDERTYNVKQRSTVCKCVKCVLHVDRHAGVLS